MAQRKSFFFPFLLFFSVVFPALALNNIQSGVGGGGGRQSEAKSSIIMELLFIPEIASSPFLWTEG